MAKELVALQPDLILSHITLTTAALLQQTRTIPVIFATVTDPVGSGFVASFPRPGGNVTGFTSIEPTLPGKCLELLKEIAPRVTRATVLFNPVTAPYIGDFFLKPLKAAALSSGVEVIVAPIRDMSELESIVAAQAREPNSGLIGMPDAFLDDHRADFTSLAARYRVPAIIRSVNTLKLVAWHPMEMTSRIIFGALRSMPIASCVSPSRASFRSRRRSSSN